MGLYPASTRPSRCRVVESLGEGLRFAQMVEELRLFAQRVQGIVQVAPQVNGLLQCVTALGEVRQGRERLLEDGHGLVVR